MLFKPLTTFNTLFAQFNILQYQWELIKAKEICELRKIMHFLILGINVIKHETFNLRLLHYNNNNNVQATFTIYPQKKKKTKQILHSKPYEWIHIAKQFAYIFKSDMWVICLFKLSFPAECQGFHDRTILLRLTNEWWGPCTPPPPPLSQATELLRFLNICNCLAS